MIETREILLNAFFENELKVGETACFVEEYNASTGYLWSVIPDNSGVYELVETKTLYPSVQATGVPGLLMWTFKMINKGQGAILFKLLPPGSKEPVKVIAVKLNIGEK